MPIYVGTNKIKSIYHGTTKIKKVYVGSTKVWSGEPSLNAGTSLAQSRRYTRGTKVGNYVLIGGGSVPAFINSVETYNTALVRGTAAALAQARIHIGGASHPNYAMFFTGAYYDSDGDDTTYPYADVYNSTLTKLTSPLAYPQGAHSCGGVIGDYAIFIGGYDAYYSGSDSRDNRVSAYNGALTRTTLGTETYTYYNRRSASVGNYCIWAGGEGGGLNFRNTTRAFSNTLTRVTPTSMSVPRGTHGSASIGDYALFAGGYTDKTNGDISNTVSVFNSTLVEVTPLSLPAANAGLSGGNYDNYAVFTGNGSPVRLFDPSLVRTELSSTISIREPSILELGNNTIITAGIGSTTTSAMYYLN